MRLGKVHSSITQEDNISLARVVSSVGGDSIVSSQDMHRQKVQSLTCPTQQKVAMVLSTVPQTVDELSIVSEVPVHVLRATLMMLEMEGVCTQQALGYTIPST